MTALLSLHFVYTSTGSHAKVSMLLFKLYTNNIYFYIWIQKSTQHAATHKNWEQKLFFFSFAHVSGYVYSTWNVPSVRITDTFPFSLFLTTFLLIFHLEHSRRQSWKITFLEWDGEVVNFKKCHSFIQKQINNKTGEKYPLNILHINEIANCNASMCCQNVALTINFSLYKMYLPKDMIAIISLYKAPSSSAPTAFFAVSLSLCVVVETSDSSLLTQ